MTRAKGKTEAPIDAVREEAYTQGFVAGRGGHEKFTDDELLKVATEAQRAYDAWRKARRAHAQGSRPLR